MALIGATTAYRYMYIAPPPSRYSYFDTETRSVSFWGLSCHYWIWDLLARHSKIDALLPCGRSWRSGGRSCDSRMRALLRALLALLRALLIFLRRLVLLIVHGTGGPVRFRFHTGRSHCVRFDST